MGLQVNVHSHEATVNTTQDMRTEASNLPSHSHTHIHTYIQCNLVVPTMHCAAHCLEVLCVSPGPLQVGQGDRIFVADRILDVCVDERAISPTHIPVRQEFDGLSQNGIDGSMYARIILHGRSVCLCEIGRAHV